MANDVANQPLAEEELEPTMDKLLYRQVYQNAKDILNMLREFNGDVTQLTQWIQNINNAIFGGDPEGGGSGIDPTVEGTGDVRGKLPDLNVIGAHALDDAADEDLLPSSYNRLITYEIKNCATIGLDTLDDVTSTQTILVTWIPTAQSIAGINAFQLAYVNDGIVYSRIADADGTAWGEWQTGTIGGGGGSSDAIISETEPEDQAEGEYWLEPITGNPPDPNYPGTSTDEGEAEPEPEPEPEPGTGDNTEAGTDDTETSGGTEEDTTGEQTP